MRQSRGGFSLIELMVALVIVGILGVFGTVKYAQYQARSRRAEAWGVILELTQYMERNYLNNNGYTVGLPNSLTYPVPPITQVPRTGGTPYYTITVKGATNVYGGYTTPYGDDSGSINPYGYQILASPVGLMANDPCGNLVAVQPSRNGNALVKFATGVKGLTFDSTGVTGSNTGPNGEWCY